MLPRMMWTKARYERKRSCHARIQSNINYGPSDELSEKTALIRQHLVSDDQSINGTNWMSFLNDSKPISALSIPGTHDSAAYSFSWPFVRTQNLNIEQQLNAGIRYFDFRCGLVNGVVEMVHGTIILQITLETLLDTIYAWLDTYPSEALIVQIKEDRKPTGQPTDFPNAILGILSTRPKKWRTTNTTPTLSALRGKIQLLRRFPLPPNQIWGIDVSPWPDNPNQPFTITTPNQSITIQDHYTFSASLPTLIKRKTAAVTSLLSLAASNPDSGHWYLNFTSAYEFTLLHRYPPKEIAVGGYWGIWWKEGVNLLVEEWFALHGGKRRWGVVAMDFPELVAEGLVEGIVRSNFEARDGGLGGEGGWVGLFCGVMAVASLVFWLLVVWFACWGR